MSRRGLLVRLTGTQTAARFAQYKNGIVSILYCFDPYIWGGKMVKKTWGKIILSTLIVAASLFYSGVAQAGAPPPFTKSFVPDTINVGGVSTLTFSISGPGVPALNNMAFTDTLPAGVVVASPTNQSQTCMSGMLSATPGSNMLSYSGGSVAGGTSCTISVDVTSNTAGMHVNTSSLLTFNMSGMAGPATDTLTVNAMGIPTVPQWGVLLLTLSLLAMATWQLAGRPIAVIGGSSDTLSSLPTHSQWLTSILIGQVIATLGLGVYALLIGPLVPHDGVGAFLAGLLIGVMVECYRRSSGR